MQVLTTWQSCVYVIYVYPHFPDLVAAMNALAEAEGDPSFHDIAAQAASDAEAAAEVDVSGNTGLISPVLSFSCVVPAFIACCLPTFVCVHVHWQAVCKPGFAVQCQSLCIAGSTLQNLTLMRLYLYCRRAF